MAGIVINTLAIREMIFVNNIYKRAMTVVLPHSDPMVILDGKVTYVEMEDENVTHLQCSGRGKYTTLTFAFV